jgi:hypothetical protein
LAGQDGDVHLSWLCIKKRKILWFLPAGLREVLVLDPTGMQSLDGWTTRRKDASISDNREKRGENETLDESHVCITNERILVQLQGKYGNAQLHLPTSQESALRLGDECTLEHSTGGIIKIIGELDEAEERLKASNDEETKVLLDWVIGAKGRSCSRIEKPYRPLTIPNAKDASVD